MTGQQGASGLERPFPLWLRRLLGIPLAWKLAGANAIVVAAALITATVLHGSTPRDREMLFVLALALAGSFVVNLGLVVLALRPLRTLEGVATLVREGKLQARVVASPIADRDLRRVGNALNGLLDELEAERVRIRRLASEVIRVGDQERASIARELHDSTAQRLSAVVLQLAAIADDKHQPEMAARLDSIRTAARDALEEVRLLAHTTYPRVLDDLGLPAALRHLGREVGQHAGVEVAVDAPKTSVVLPAELASVLYRVAQEAMSNAIRHATPATVRMQLRLSVGSAVLEVVDDGRGFDPANTKRHPPGVGIFSMRERVALVDGSLEIVSQPGRGTRVVATVPVVRRGLPEGGSA